MSASQAAAVLAIICGAMSPIMISRIKRFKSSQLHHDDSKALEAAAEWAETEEFAKQWLLIRDAANALATYGDAFDALIDMWQSWYLGQFMHLHVEGLSQLAYRPDLQLATILATFDGALMCIADYGNVDGYGDGVASVLDDGDGNGGVGGATATNESQASIDVRGEAATAVAAAEVHGKSSYVPFSYITWSLLLDCSFSVLCCLLTLCCRCCYLGIFEINAYNSYKYVYTCCCAYKPHLPSQN